MTTKDCLSIFLAVVIFATGCSTKSKNETLGGLTTVSAYMVALPLIPIALPISVGEQYSELKKDKALYAKLDPVYKKRIEMIKARSPKVDAKVAWSEGTTQFLYSTPNDNNYAELETAEYNLKNGDENLGQGNTNKLFTYLQTLVNDDPLQVQVHDWNETYIKFMDVRRKYKDEFNLQLSLLLQKEKVTGNK